MKKTIIPAALAIGLIAALITICPMAASAADNAVGSGIEPVAQIQDIGCPVTQPANSADCAGSPEQSMLSGVAMRETDNDYRMSPEGRDASRSLLEDLIRNGPDEVDLP